MRGVEVGVTLETRLISSSTTVLPALLLVAATTSPKRLRAAFLGTADSVEDMLTMMTVLFN